ncbi:MAG: alpha/beta hydrolase [Moraxellaceae bacterium]|jgi:alpha-beta hydrolase superfamily lysophospholipase|nr:alpha/beta hydrolase [Moraxellaceae bacterium]
MANRRNPDTSDVKANLFKSTFIADGDACAATLHVPEDTGARQLPGILMVGGWGSVQQALTAPFVHRFVAAGYAVMEFDFPGWGTSGGWPRQDINPWRRVRAANAALAHLKSQPQVDANRIVLWGTSFGGGHVVDLAAQHPDLYGAIIQVPMLDGVATVRAAPLRRLVQFIGYGIAGFLRPDAAIHIPTVARQGEFGSMDRDNAWEALQLGLEAQGGRKYVNRVTARSLLTMGLYRPWTRLKDVRVPMLIVGATRDTVAPFVADKVRRVANPHLQVVQIDADHFDPYFEPYFPNALKPQLSFLSEVLPV